MNKKSYLLSVLLFIGITCFGQEQLVSNNSALNVASALWENPNHDFGTIKQGVPVSTKFKFTNNGTKPLIINRVKTSCGCTASDYPKQAIAPGETAFVTVRYNAKSSGSFSKSITIYSNANEPVKNLFIKGIVSTNVSL